MRCTSKMLAIFLALSLLCSPALAYEQEIVFRGIPWGTDMQSVADTISADLEAEGASPQSVRAGRPTTGLFFYSFYENPGLQESPFANKQVYVYRTADFEAPFIVADYPISEIYAAGISTYTDGTVPERATETGFVYACYTFTFEQNKEQNACYNVLQSKLTQLYGATYMSEEKNYGLEASWLGGNETYIALALIGSRVTLAYGKTTIPIRLDELTNPTSGSFDGL